MGGEYEDKVPQKQVSVTGSVEEVGTVRFHENKGEIHFHDDKKGLKVAVPVARWFSAWQKLVQNPDEEFVYADSDNQSILTVKVQKKKSGTSVVLDCLIKIDTCKFTDAFSRVNKFSTR